MKNPKNTIKKEQLSRYKKAKKRVDLIKSFYGHLFWYVLVNVGIYIVNHVYADQYYLDNWFFINFLTTTLLWGIGVFVHGVQAFKPKLFSLIKSYFALDKDWEERKLRELLKEEKQKETASKTTRHEYE